MKKIAMILRNERISDITTEGLNCQDKDIHLNNPYKKLKIDVNPKSRKSPTLIGETVRII